MGRLKRSWIVENTWKCTHCGTQNRGRHMKCKTCGNPKDKSENYELGDTSAKVTAADQLQQASAGENWACSFCGYDNRALDDKCQSCGASRKPRFNALPPPSAPAARHMPEIPKDEYDFVPDSGTLRTPPSRIRKPTPPGDLSSNYISDPEPSRRHTPRHRRVSFFRRNKKAMYVAAVLLAVAAVISLLVWLFVPRKIEASVNQIRWEYTVLLQQRRTDSGSGWDGQVPSGAFNVSCSRRFKRNYDCNPYDCNPHTEYERCAVECGCREQCSDLGNGYSSCSEVCSTCYEDCNPHTEYDTCYETCQEYDDWCTYNYYSWPTIDREVTSGSDHNPHYGTRLRADVSRHQRIVQNSQFSVSFSCDDEFWSYHPRSLSDFRRYSQNDFWEIEVNRAGSVWPQHEIQPQ